MHTKISLREKESEGERESERVSERNIKIKVFFGRKQIEFIT